MKVRQTVPIQSLFTKRLVSATLLAYLLIVSGLPSDQDPVDARSSRHTTEFVAQRNHNASIARQPNRLRTLISHWKGFEALLTATTATVFLLRWGSPVDFRCLHPRFLAGLLLFGRSPPTLL